MGSIEVRYRKDDLIQKIILDHFVIDDPLGVLQIFNKHAPNSMEPSTEPFIKLRGGEIDPDGVGALSTRRDSFAGSFLILLFFLLPLYLIVTGPVPSRIPTEPLAFFNMVIPLTLIFVPWYISLLIAEHMYMEDIKSSIIKDDFLMVPERKTVGLLIKGKKKIPFSAISRIDRTLDPFSFCPISRVTLDSGHTYKVRYGVFDAAEETSIFTRQGDYLINNNNNPNIQKKVYRFRLESLLIYMLVYIIFTILPSDVIL